MNFELIFSVLFLVLRIYSRGSRYFLGAILGIMALGRFQLRSFFVLDFRDYNRNKI